MSAISAHGTVLRDCVVEGLRFIFTTIGVEDDEEPKDLAYRAFGVSETCDRYGPKLRAESEEIADLLVGLTDARKTRGFGLCFLHLRNVKGHPWNHMA